MQALLLGQTRLACPSHSAAAPVFVGEFRYLATCRHPTSVDPPLRDYVSGKPASRDS
jgi:hypothetical protein